MPGAPQKGIGLSEAFVLNPVATHLSLLAHRPTSFG